MPPEKGFDTQAATAYAGGGSWGTPVVLGAGDGFLVTGFNPDKGIERVSDPSLTGGPYRRRSRQGSKLYTPEVRLVPRFRGGLDLILAVLFGQDDSPASIDNSTPTQVGATHQLVPQESVWGHFLTLGFLYPGINQVKEYDTWKPGSVSLEVSSGGMLTATASGPAHDFSNSSGTNDPTSFASVTTPTPLDVIMFQDVKVRLAAQGAGSGSGGALSDTEKLAYDSASWSYERSYQNAPDGLTSQLIPEPVTSALLSGNPTIGFARLEDATFEDWEQNDTALFMDIVASGPLLTNGDAGQVHEFRFFYPQLHVANINDDVAGEGPVSIEVELEPSDADAAPEGMSFTHPYVEVDNELFTTLLA